MEFIFKYPTTKYTIRELARKTNLAPPTVLGFVRLLRKENMIREAKVARASQISADLESSAYKRKKKLYNIASIHESGLLDYLIEKYNDPKAIVLFGSYARGDDTERSDIDIAIFTSDHKRLDLKQFENRLARPISIHELNIDKVSDELKNNLYNGIVLHGAL